MKSIKYFFLMATAFAGCAGYSQKTTDVVKIEFTSLTRGYNKQVVITTDSVTTATNIGRGSEMQTQKKKLSSKEWETLISAMQGILLTEIPSLKSPTEKRTYDGAKHSTISITTLKGEILSHSFDDEEPHEKLQKLMREISKLSDSVK